MSENEQRPAILPITPDAPRAIIRFVSRPMTPEREAAIHRFWTAVLRKFDGPSDGEAPAD